MNNNQQPGWPQQPSNQPQQPEDGPAYPPVPPAPGHGQDHGQGQSWPPPQSQQYGQQQPGQPYGQQPYGDPQQYGQPFGQAPQFTQPAPKSGMPVWGWVAGGVGVVAVIAVAGVLAFNGLSGGSKGPDAVPAPAPTVSESAAARESADASPSAGADAAGAVYLFDESDFSTPPAWTIQEPKGWAKEEVKDGMLRYRNAGLQCTFTTYQAVLQPTGENGDEATTALVMASEIEAVKKSAGKPVEVVNDTASTYVSLRDGGQDIELQEARLRFKNDKDVDVTYRMAVRATASSNGLMELALACPGSLATEAELWLELTDGVRMVDAP
ncbi:hypothetical protein ACS5PJ_17500 [Pseudarthrobacter sp. YS3]|uniref:hypothetical protein n=1 Tax=Pseudarthrobacter sp. YS3 TaxID=3453718 RepID=UPI003EECBB1C